MGEMGLVEEEEAMKSPVMVVLMETVQMEGMGQGRTFPPIHLNTSTSVLGKGGTFYSSWQCLFWGRRGRSFNQW